MKDLEKGGSSDTQIKRRKMEEQQYHCCKYHGDCDKKENSNRLGESLVIGIVRQIRNVILE
jgi:hypothetical protein